MNEIYLDNSATTRPYEEVVQVVQNAVVDYYNPSAVYDKAIFVSKKIEDVRKNLLKSIHAKSGTMVFTSGGTEAINAAIGSNLRKDAAVVTTAYEHDATVRITEKLEQEGYKVIRVSPFHQKINMEDLLEKIDDKTALVSVMHVNNEAGHIIDICSLGKAIKKINPRTLFHVDAVQSYMKLPIDVEACRVDFLSISGHKIHGIKGIGALYVRHPEKFKPMIYGGGQEQGLRSGTENVAGILALGKAVEIGMPKILENQEKLREIRDYFISRLGEIEDSIVNSPQDGASHILNASFLGVPSEILLHTLESKGIYVSSGSACSSKKKGSRTLDALGISSEAKKSALRFSFSCYNSKEEMELVMEELKSAVANLRKITKYKR